MLNHAGVRETAEERDERGRKEGEGKHADNAAAGGEGGANGGGENFNTVSKHSDIPT